MASFLISAISAVRPNRLTDDKNEGYHLRFGKWAISMGLYTAMQSDYIRRGSRNEDFYRNFQWKSQEDIDTFLKDQSGQDRNRIMFTMNMIRPIVERFRGSSLRMDINFEAVNDSPFSVRRKEQELKRKLFYTDQALKIPYFADGLKKRLFIGDTEEETVSLHENTYVDELTRSVNYLMRRVSEYNEFDEQLKLHAAEQVALWGLGVTHNKEYSGRQVFQPVLTRDFFWDRNARKPNLQDSEYMGFVEYLNAPQILETAVLPLDEQARQSIENYDKRAPIQFYNGYDNVRTGQPVVNAFWRDTQSEWFGYVMDEFGVPMFTQINNKGEDGSEPKYTDKDLIDPPKTYAAQRRMRGQKKIRRDVDLIRFCRFIPYFASQGSGINTPAKEGQVDIVLDYGLLPYQDKKHNDYRNVVYPFACWTWSYINGEVSSPIDDAINPQRFLNRAMSVAENQMNNSGGTGVAYDEDSLTITEEEATSKINQGVPIPMAAKGRGINNVIGKYDASVSGSTYKLFDLIPAMRSIVQGSTGHNEAMQGQAMGQDQLVGVTDALLQQGDILQAPFYHAVLMIFKQMYESIANIGKRIYIDNQHELIAAVGDHDGNVIMISEDAKMEDFRIKINMEASVKMQIAAADQAIIVFLSQGLIDQTRATNLLGRATMTDVFRAMREYAADKVIMSREQAKAQQQQQQEMIQGLQQAQQEQKQAEDEAKAFELVKMDHKTNNDIRKKRDALVTKSVFDPPAPGLGR